MAKTFIVCCILIIVSCTRTENISRQTLPVKANDDFVKKIFVLTPPVSQKLADKEKNTISSVSKELSKFFDKSGITCEITDAESLVPSDIPSGKHIILVTTISSLSDEQWDKIEKFIASSDGTIIWQGMLARNSILLDSDRKHLEDIAGVKISGYAADEKIGLGAVDRFMWISPTADGRTDIFKDYAKDKIFAAFAGEAVAIEPAGQSRTEAEWLRRDRTNSDGAALIVKSHPSGAKSIFFSNYLFITAMRQDVSSPEVKAGREIFNACLRSAGCPIPEEESEKKSVSADTRPVNWTEINPKIQCPRSMWVWNNENALDEEKSEELLKFCDLRKITVIYLYTGKDFFKGEGRVEKIRAFIMEAGKRKIEVEALDGWPEAVLEKQRKNFLSSIEAVIAYNRSVAEKERFAGFQSDVEPGGIEDYHKTKESRKKINTMFIGLNRDCYNLCKQSGLPNFRFGLALSENYDGIGKIDFEGKDAYICDHLARFVDYFAIMSYHDKAAETASNVSYEIELAEKSGKTAWIGFETLDAAGQYRLPREITFYEEGLEIMEKEIEKVLSIYGRKKGFGGIAIHHYDAYKKLQNERMEGIYKAPSYSASYVPENIVIDASKSDWAKVPEFRFGEKKYVVHGKELWKGEQDLSANAGIAWNEQNIYILVDVKDDKLQICPDDKELWKGDHVGIWISEGKENSPVFQFGISPKEKKPGVYMWYPKSYTESAIAETVSSMSAQAIRTDSGYIVECKIPAKTLGINGFKDTAQLYVTIDVGDCDSETEPHKSLISLSPIRERGNPMTFVRLCLVK